MPATDCCMAASHFWDTIGAQGTGLKAAFIRRKGNALLPVAGIPQPDYVAENILALAKELSKGSQDSSHAGSLTAGPRLFR